MFQKESRRAVSSGRWRVSAAFIATLAVVGVTTFGGVQDANAAQGLVSDLGVSISFDGTGPFDTDNISGHDSGANNGVVRSNDQVEYLIASSFATVGDVSYTSTLPAGMEWDATATASTVCNGVGGGSLTNANRTWTCNRTTDTLAESFKVRAWVGSAGHDQILAPTVTSGSVQTVAPEIRVSAIPKTEFRSYTNGLTMPFVHQGTEGARQQITVHLGATVPPAGNFKGYEALSDPLSFELSVPPNAVVPLVQPDLQGSASVSQPGGPGTPVTVSVSGQRTDFLKAKYNAGTPTDFRDVATLYVYIWTPYESIPVNVPTLLVGQFRNFDPLSTSGQSNFGTGVAPGFEAGAACSGTAIGLQTSCYGQSITRTDRPLVFGGTNGAMAGYYVYIYGDDHGWTNGREFVVPGQKFFALSSVRNDQTAGAPAMNAWGVSAWDPAKLQLTTTPEVRLNLTSGQTHIFHQITGTVVPKTDYVLKYTDHAFANDAERKNFDPATLDWVTNPAALPGGLASVSAVHLTYLKPLPVNSTLGLANPLARPLSADSLSATADSLIPWYWQFGSDETPRVASTYNGTTTISETGGNIRVANALVRTKASWDAASTEPGSIKNLTITPTVVGPVGGSAATEATNMKVSVALDSTCAEPVWDVVKTLPGYESHTPGNHGADGIACTADDGAAAKVVFAFGDVSAPAGTVGPGEYHGHATQLPSFTIPVTYSPLSPSGGVHTATVVASSDADKTQGSYAGWGNIAVTALSQDRTETAAITVQGVASFQGGKSANTREAGLVSPDEEFSYTINWSNGTSDKVGVGTFVDVLPYNGDARGSSGLPAEGFTVIKAVSSTANTSVMGNVSIEYSDDAPEDIAAALLQPENSDGHSGITWKTGTVPSSATALRFVTEKPIESGFSGSATITVALKGLAIGGQLKNDFYGKTAAVDGDQNSVKRIVGAAEVTLASSAGSLAGSVWRDLDFDGGFSPADVAWPAGSKTLTITSANETYTTNIGSNGSFDFGVIAAGDYVASVKDARGWSLVLSHPITFGVGDVVDDARILFQEQLAPLALKPDTGSTSAGASTVVDVKTNDSWVTAAAPAPQTFSSIQAGGEPTFGTASITADGKLTYASAADWPAAFDGQTSYEDTVTYSVTDSAGLTATTVVTLTIYAAPVAVDDTITIGQSGKTALDALANDTGHTITFDGDIVSTSDVRVSEDGDKVSVESLHVWADGEATFVDTVAYTISDEFGQVSTASIVVTVQRAPVVTVDAGQVIASGGEAVFTPQLLNPGVVSDDDRTVSKRPSAGTVTMEDDGTVSFVPGNAAPGDYSFEITYTDDLGQATTQAFTVTVYAALQLTNDRATVPWISPTAIDVLANDAGDGLVLLRAQVIDGAETEGTIEVTADGLKFTPSPDREWAVDELSYIETLEYTAADGHGDEATATLTLTVIRPPVGKDVHLDLSSDVESVTFDPVGEATGTDIQGLSKDAVVTKPVHGTASILAGELTYTPEAGFIGDDNFTVRLVDAFGQTGEVTYTFTIVAAKAPEEGGNGVEPHEGAGGGGTGSAEGNNGNGGMPGTPETAATDSGLALTGTGSAVWSLGALCLAAGFALWLFASARSRRQPALGSSRQA